MPSEAPQIVQRLWNYCNVLRDDGVSYGDYVEQLTYLLFLKMNEEQATFFDQDSAIPEGYGWGDLWRLDGAELEDFVACYRAGSRHAREETEQFRAFDYEELVARDKANLDLFWLRDESLEDIENLPEPEVLAAEIVENLEAALEQFRSIAEELEETT